MTLEEYDRFIRVYYNYTFLPLKDKYKSHEVNAKVKERIEELIMQLIKRKITE